MNRKNLTAAVLAGLAGVVGIVGSAQAVNVNPDGIGQVLIYPYYTTNANNVTLLSVVNTSDYAKAVKVRFLEGKNSREVLDFNLYMSRYDVWTAAVVLAPSKDMAGIEVPMVPTLITTDNSCTVPYIYGYDNLADEDGGSQEFLPYAMNDLTDASGNPITDLGDISRATEGHFEVIDMGTLTNDIWGSATAITHIDGELPAYDTTTETGGCQQLINAWTDPDDLVAGDEGYWLKTSFDDIDAPMGGLFGGAAIVNVGVGTMYSYDAKAVDGFSDEEMHARPGTTKPNLNSGNIPWGNVFKGGEVVSYEFDTDRTVDAVSYVFLHDSLMNEYTTNDLINGSTEWVVTFPTKHFYVYEPNSSSATAVAPFTSIWDGSEACEVILLDTIWDRNEQQPGTPDDPTGEPIPPIVSPAPPDVTPPTKPGIVPFELCFETNVIGFGEDSGDILGSSSLHTINNDTELFTSQNGWARLGLYDYSFDADQDGVVDCVDGSGSECLFREQLGNLVGLPVTGFAVSRFENTMLGEGADVLANYGGIFQHKATRKMGSMASE